MGLNAPLTIEEHLAAIRAPLTAAATDDAIPPAARRALLEMLHEEMEAAYHALEQADAPKDAGVGAMPFTEAVRRVTAPPGVNILSV